MTTCSIPSRRRPWSRPTPAAVALAMLGLAAAGCTHEAPPAPAAAQQQGSLFTVPAAQRARLRPVKVVKQSLIQPIEVPALVGFDDLKTSAVTPLVGGKVSRVLVQEGAKVKAGQALLLIASPDSSDVTANLARDQAGAPHQADDPGPRQGPLRAQGDLPRGAAAGDPRRRRRQDHRRERQDARRVHRQQDR